MQSVLFVLPFDAQLGHGPSHVRSRSSHRMHSLRRTSLFGRRGSFSQGWAWILRTRARGAYSLSYDFRFLGCVTTSLNGSAMGTLAAIFAMGRNNFLAILASIASASHWLDSFLF